MPHHKIVGWRSVHSEMKSTLLILKNCKYVAKDYGSSGGWGQGLLWAFLFVCFIEKENNFVFQKSGIPNIETVPCLFKNLERRSKRQTGLMTIFNCRTLTSDCMAVIGR